LFFRLVNQTKGEGREGRETSKSSSSDKRSENFRGTPQGTINGREKAKGVGRNNGS